MCKEIYDFRVSLKGESNKDMNFTPKKKQRHELSNFLADCKVLLDRLKAEVCHIFREANRSSDAIAKAYFSSIDGTLVVIPFRAIPNCINQVILDDVRRVKRFPEQCLFSFIYASLTPKKKKKISIFFYSPNFKGYGVHILLRELGYQ